MCATCDPRHETARAAVVWRDPDYPPPAVAHWQSVKFAAPTMDAALSKAREWRDEYGVHLRVSAIVNLGVGFASEAA